MWRSLDETHATVRTNEMTQLIILAAGSMIHNTDQNLKRLWKYWRIIYVHYMEAKGNPKKKVTNSGRSCTYQESALLEYWKSQRCGSWFKRVSNFTWCTKIDCL